MMTLDELLGKLHDYKEKHGGNKKVVISYEGKDDDNTPFSVVGLVDDIGATRSTVIIIGKPFND